MCLQDQIPNSTCSSLAMRGLQAEVERRFSVKVHVNTIGVWLHDLGLTRLQPRPVHPKKDPEAEATF